MRLPKFALALSFALSTVVLTAPSTGCTHSTTVEHVWRSPDWAGSFSNVVIFGMSKRAGVRRAFELGVADRLRQSDVGATPSHELFPGDAELDDEQIAAVLSERGIDGVLVARLVAIDTKQQYVEGTPYTVAHGPRPMFYGYYHRTWDTVYSPGYTIEYDIVTVDSNLYDVASGELVWSGLSETFDPKDVEDGVRSYAAAMTKALLEAGLVSGTPPQ